MYILLIAVIALLILLFDQCNRKNTALSILKESEEREDYYYKFIDTQGREQTRIYSTFQNYQKLLDSLKISIKNIKLNKTNSSVNYFTTSMPIRFQSKPFVIRDFNNEPTFIDTIKGYDHWITGTMLMNKDTSLLNLNVDADYVVMNGYEKQKWWKFKKAIPFSMVYNLNPYVRTKEFKVYKTNTPVPKRFGAGVSITYGLTSDFKFQPCIGIGISYNLITF